MSKKRLTTEQLLESIDLGLDDSAIDFEDQIELRYETEDEVRKTLRIIVMTRRKF
jgi:hypothetical protein